MHLVGMLRNPEAADLVQHSTVQTAYMGLTLG